MGLSWSLFLITHLYLRGLWLGVDLKTDNKRASCLEESGLCAKCLLIILGSIAMIEENRPLVTDETVEFEK